MIVLLAVERITMTDLTLDHLLEQATDVVQVLWRAKAQHTADVLRGNATYLYSPQAESTQKTSGHVGPGEARDTNIQDGLAELGFPL